MPSTIVNLWKKATKHFTWSRRMALWLTILILALGATAFTRWLQHNAATEGFPIAIDRYPEEHIPNDLGKAIFQVNTATGYQPTGWLEDYPYQSWCVVAFADNLFNQNWCFEGFSGTDPMNGAQGKFLIWTDRPDYPMVLATARLPIYLWGGPYNSDAQAQMEKIFHREEETLFIKWWALDVSDYNALKTAGMPELNDLPYLCSPVGTSHKDAETCIGSK